MSFTRYLQGWRTIDDSDYHRVHSVISNLPNYSVIETPSIIKLSPSGYELRKKNRKGEIHIELATIGPKIRLFTESLHLVQRIEKVRLPKQELSSIL